MNFDCTDWEHDGKTHSGSYAKAPKGQYRETTIAVNSFDPNAFGLYNMHGNIWEWCLDPWHGNYNDAPKDDRIWDASNDSGSKRRLIRGGSWNFNPDYCRSAVRCDVVPAHQFYSIGFRVVYSPSRGPS